MALESGNSSGVSPIVKLDTNNILVELLLFVSELIPFRHNFILYSYIDKRHIIYNEK